MWWFNKKANENKSKLETIKNTINTLFKVNNNGERAIKSIDEYTAATQTLGSLIIEFLGGGDMITVNGDLEYKFSRELPGWELVSELQGSLQPYVEAVVEFESQKANSSNNGDSDFLDFNSQSNNDPDFTPSANTKKALGKAFIDLYKDPNVLYMPENICRIYKEITRVMKAVKSKTAIIISSCAGVTLIGLGCFLKIHGKKKKVDTQEKKYNHKERDSKDYDHNDYNPEYKDTYEYTVFIDESPLDDVPVDVESTVTEINKKFGNGFSRNMTNEFNF